MKKLKVLLFILVPILIIGIVSVVKNYVNNKNYTDYLKLMNCRNTNGRELCNIYKEGNINIEEEREKGYTYSYYINGQKIWTGSGEYRKIVVPERLIDNDYVLVSIDKKDLNIKLYENGEEKNYNKIYKVFDKDGNSIIDIGTEFIVKANYNEETNELFLVGINRSSNVETICENYENDTLAYTEKTYKYENGQFNLTINKEENVGEYVSQRYYGLSCEDINKKFMKPNIYVNLVDNTCETDGKTKISCELKEKEHEENECSRDVIINKNIVLDACNGNIYKRYYDNYIIIEEPIQNDKIDLENKGYILHKFKIYNYDGDLLLEKEYVEIINPYYYANYDLNYQLKYNDGKMYYITYSTNKPSAELEIRSIDLTSNDLVEKTVKKLNF